MNRQLLSLVFIGLCMVCLTVGCNPPPEQQNGNTDSTDKVNPSQVETPQDPVDDERTLEYIRSFAGRTEDYDMLGVQESKQWMRKHKFTVTDKGNNYAIQRNYVSGRIKKRNKVTIPKGGRSLTSIRSRKIPGDIDPIKDISIIFTDDDEGNIRVGFYREE